VPDPQVKNKPHFDQPSYEGRYYYAPDDDIPLDDEEAEAFFQCGHI
jgi:hypothetical protein